MAGVSTPVEIFCCYSHTDEIWLRKLEIHLSLLKRQGLISLWHDRLIDPGADWDKAIDTHLETASVILLLVSADFIASDYCYSVEMQYALKRHEAGEARVIPLLVRPVDWKDAPFAHLHALPTDAKPLSIWLDEDLALTNVVAGIRRVLEDLPRLSASVPRAALPPIWNTPYSRNPFFLGRERELEQVHQHLQAGQAVAFSQPQAISGLGGIGKTQLALEYTYRYHQDYTAVMWARAENTDALISSYVNIATLLRLPEREAKEQEIIMQAVKTWLQTHRDWLLILDNADELTLLSDFLPPSLGGHLLLTTRATALGRLAQRLEIETLRPAQGALFLLRRAALLGPFATLEQAPGEERELALYISEQLGGLPLALDQAGAYLEEMGMDLAGYWQLYQHHRTDLLAKRGGLVPDHPTSVATTWSLSFQRVEEKNPAAADLLRLCAFLSPDAIPEEILTADTTLLGPALAEVTANASLLNPTIGDLRAYSLVQRDPKAKTISIHRLVQAVFQDRLSETEKRLWAERAMLQVNSIFPDAEPWTWPQCERLLPQALAAAQIIEQYQMIGEEAGRLLHKTASYLQARARYSEAESLYLRARRVFEQHLGPEHPHVAAPLGGLASLCYEQGKYVEAQQLYQQAFQIWEQHPEPEHPQMATLLNGLASLYRHQGKYTQVEPLCQHALRIWEQHLGDEHPQVTYPLHNLAMLYRHQGRYAEAEPLYRRVLRIWEHRLGTEHAQIAYPLTGLAILYCEQGRYADAEPLFQRALSIREHSLGVEHPQIAYALTGLADISKKKGNYAEAELLFQRALSIREHQLAPEHPLIAYSLTGLAMLYGEQGKYTETEPLVERALHILEQQLDSLNRDTAEIMHNCAQLREGQGNSEEARTWYVRAQVMREHVLGAQHPKTTETRTRLIALLRAQGQYEQTAQLEAAYPEQ